MALRKNTDDPCNEEACKEVAMAEITVTLEEKKRPLYVQQTFV